MREMMQDRQVTVRISAAKRIAQPHTFQNLAHFIQLKGKRRHENNNKVFGEPLDTMLGQIWMRLIHVMCEGLDERVKTIKLITDLL